VPKNNKKVKPRSLSTIDSQEYEPANVMRPTPVTSIYRKMSLIAKTKSFSRLYPVPIGHANLIKISMKKTTIIVRDILFTLSLNNLSII